MCGIVGIISNSKELSAIRGLELIEQMLSKQTHRGPDDQGREHFKIKNSDCFLGFNRLSIRDLSMNGHQPMISKDGNVAIVYNGEIYNANEIKTRLELKNYKFQSESDTEVLLYCYIEYGIEATLKQLVGMFAFCIVDKKCGKIYFARDRFGEKPLYYYIYNSGLIFGSEIKSFYPFPEFKPEINLQALDEFFMYRYVSGEETLFRGVKNLPPSCWAEFDGKSLIIHKYYTQNIRHKWYETKSVEKYIREAVKGQLVSDVPLGIMLSGGIDSSLIAKYASDEVKIQSFSTIFEDESCSEEKWIDQVASTCNIISNKFLIDTSDFFDLLAKCIYHLDFPLNIPNTVGVYLLCKEAREKVTVLLTGEGADETWGGYRYATDARTCQTLKKIFPHCYTKFKVFKDFDTFHFGKNIHFDILYILRTACITKENLYSLYPNANPEKVIEKRFGILNSINGKGYHRYSQYDQKTYLENLLTRVDKMSMANSMEMRCPFLDHKTIDYVRTLSGSSFISLTLGDYLARFNGKKPLKKIAEKYFGKNFAYRKKMGWSMPLRNYFNSSEFTNLAEKVLIPGMKKRGIINTDAIEERMNRIDQLSFSDVGVLWIAVSFELWAQIFIDYRGDYAKFTEVLHL